MPQGPGRAVRDEHSGRKSAFEFVSGEDRLQRYESSPGKYRYFCSACGSPVFSARTALPDVVRVRAGLLDDPLPVRPGSHAFVGSKCNWWPIDGGLPQYQDAYVNPPEV
jgi:hypothetical protein